MSEARILIVVAVAENGVIGADGDMPWRLSSDLKRFKEITLGKPMIMGRKTFDSIGKALPGRTTIVITRDATWQSEGVVLVSSLEKALELAAQCPGGDEAISIVGGGQIYALAMEHADELHVTHVDAAPEGDTVFPEIDPKIWNVDSSLDVPAGEKDSASTRYVVYSRK